MDPKSIKHLRPNPQRKPNMFRSEVYLAQGHNSFVNMQLWLDTVCWGTKTGNVRKPSDDIHTR